MDLFLVFILVGICVIVGVTHIALPILPFLIGILCIVIIVLSIRWLRKSTYNDKRVSGTIATAIVIWIGILFCISCMNSDSDAGLGLLLTALGILMWAGIWSILILKWNAVVNPSDEDYKYPDLGKMIIMVLVGGGWTALAFLTS